MARQALHNLESRIVEVDRKNLLETLETNKKDHIKEYEQAKSGYVETALEKLDESVKKAHERLDKQAEKVREKIKEYDPDNNDYSHLVLVDRIIFDLPAPRSYESAYDDAILIAEHDVNETLKLTFAEVKCFMSDNWEWTSNFKSINSTYLVGE